MAIQLPTQPSERLNVPAPVFPAKRPTAVRVMPPPAPTECNVPSGSTAPLPPLLMIFPPIILAGNEPVCGQPALVKIHAPSKLLSPCCGGERGVSSEGDFGSFRGSDRNDNLTLPTRAWVCAGSEATTSKVDNNAVLGHIRTIPSSEFIFGNGSAKPIVLPRAVWIASGGELILGPRGSAGGSREAKAAVFWKLKRAAIGSACAIPANRRYINERFTTLG
jgi:hypothetical protein